MRLLLIRHGPSLHLHVPGLLDVNGMHLWRSKYDEVGIADDPPPPPSLVSEIARVSRVVASNLPRAVESAARLRTDAPHEISTLFQEIPLRIPTLGGARVPFMVWHMLITGTWFIDIWRNRDRDDAARERVRDAAAWCTSQCERHESVAVVTHGVMRRALAMQLVEDGWTFRSPRRSYANWSAWELTR